MMRMVSISLRRYIRCRDRDLGGTIILNSVSQKRRTYGLIPVYLATSPIR